MFKINNKKSNIMIDKIKSVVNAWWFETAATALAGIVLLAYGKMLYAGIALGWAARRMFSVLKSETK
jgi:hypothetical protein